MNYEENAIYDWFKIEAYVFNIVDNYTKKLIDFGVTIPFYVQMSLLMAKNYQSYNITLISGYEKELERDVVNSSEGILDETNTILDCMKPVLNSLANCFGNPKSVFISQFEKN